MRLPAWFAALTGVALAAWLLLDGGPRRGGDGVSREVAPRPATLAVRCSALHGSMESVRATDSDQAVRRGQMLVVVLE